MATSTTAAEAGMMDDYPSLKTLGNPTNGEPANDPSSSTTTTTNSNSQATSTSNASEIPAWIHRAKNQELAVYTPSKVEVELNASMLEVEETSLIWVVLKWIVTFLIMAAVLFCLSTNKITAIQLSQNLRQHRLEVNITNVTDPHPKSCTKADENASSIFIMLLLTLMVPQAFTLIVAMWRGSFRSDRPWPSNKALFAGFVASLLEVVGLTLFGFEIMSQTEPHVSVLLMNGVFLIPILSQSVLLVVNKTDKKWYVLLFVFVVAFCLEVGGIILAIIFENDKEHYESSRIWDLPVALSCVSVAWSPWLQNLQITPRKLSEKELEACKRARARSILKNAKANGQEGQVDDQVTQQFALDEAEKDPSKSARWKQTILTSFWKLLLTPAIAVLFGYVLHIYYIGKLGCGFSKINTSHAMFIPFMINIFLTFSGYWLAIIGCAMCMQIATFAIPLILTSPLTVALTFNNDTCWNLCQLNCTLLDNNFNELDWVIPALACLYVAQLLSTGYHVLRSQTIVMHPESKLFWLPGYCGVFLEQILLLGRKTPRTDRRNMDVIHKAERIRVYICTTMYRENEEEMEQLMRSLSTINRVQVDSKTHFESHVFFDGAVRETKLTEFVLQLVALVDRTLDVKPGGCTKVLTPYGMRLTWRLPPSDDDGMLFNIHLKDNIKVKNKKRWSQIMYMSYVIDWLMKQEEGVRDDETFILTTDADVRFSPDSVEALLDLMTRDSSVGAVCARTHPLGSGPVVWYQIFDYAIGHWFQKVANDVLGSVLCCPGCFSVYRVRALRDVVSTYASNVTRASEFLTKDMGEDRWLCTLMVQSGWRLEYCAVSEDKTHCPDEFDEFYKQRRRWIPSTLANQALLLQEWNIATHFNNHIGYIFLMYQAVLLFSTLIGPATCMLVITGGLHYAYGWSQVGIMIALIVITVVYTLICLYATQETQLMVAKLLTFLFALVMAAVAVGTATQIVDDLTPAKNDTSAVTTPMPPPHNLSAYLMNQAPSTTTPKPGIGHGIPGSISTYYFGGIVGIFLIAGLLHLTEIYCLIHGIWYWLCLPSGYLLLTIYGVCNITDRSWGTREEKTAKILDDLTWQEQFMEFFWKVFFCCAKKEPSQKEEVEEEKTRPRRESYSSIPEEPDDGERVTSIESTRYDDDLSEGGLDAALQATFYASDGLLKQALRAGDTTIPIRRWLRYRFKKYAPLFEDKGYDTSGLIHGMSNAELKDIGITKGADRRALLDDIKLLPPTDIETAVPNDYCKWLEEVGLPMYKSNFKKNHFTDKKGFERLKAMSIEELTKDLGVKKPGHLKRLIVAITKLRYPTDREIRIRQAKWEISNAELYDLKRINKDEYIFWTKLTEKVLRPESKAFGQEDDLKDKLGDLRNTTLMAFAIVNALWILIMMTVSSQTSLNLFGSNAVGVMSLFIFGLAMIIQVLCMVYHRLTTLMHRLARAPFTSKGIVNSSWSFQKTSLEPIDPDEEMAIRTRNATNAEVRRRMTARSERTNTVASTSTTATLMEETASEKFRLMKPADSQKRLYHSVDERRPLLTNQGVSGPI